MKAPLHAPATITTKAAAATPAAVMCSAPPHRIHGLLASTEPCKPSPACGNDSQCTSLKAAVATTGYTTSTPATPSRTRSGQAGVLVGVGATGGLWVLAGCLRAVRGRRVPRAPPLLAGGTCSLSSRPLASAAEGLVSTTCKGGGRIATNLLKTTTSQELGWVNHEFVVSMWVLVYASVTKQP